MWKLLLCGISTCFQMLSPTLGQVTHVLLTHPPLTQMYLHFDASIKNQLPEFARLACIRHAASVHPEPGSNSHIRLFVTHLLIITNELTSLFHCCLNLIRPTQLALKLCSVFKGLLLVNRYCS